MRKLITLLLFFTFSLITYAQQVEPDAKAVEEVAKPYKKFHDKVEEYKKREGEVKHEGRRKGEKYKKREREVKHEGRGKGEKYKKREGHGKHEGRVMVERYNKGIKSSSESIETDPAEKIPLEEQVEEK